MGRPKKDVFYNYLVKREKAPFQKMQTLTATYLWMALEDDGEMEKRLYKDGEPCEHSSCLAHTRSPCEGCGRITGHYQTGMARYRERIIQQNLAEDNARKWYIRQSVRALKHGETGVIVLPHSREDCGFSPNYIKRHNN